MHAQKIFIFFLIGSFAFIAINSCKKENTTPTTTTGKLSLHLHTNADTNEIAQYGDTMVMTGGRRIAVTKAQLYISGVQLINSDGSTTNAPASNILKLQETESYTVGDVAVGNYKSVKFIAGLSVATNASTPAATDLVLYRPEMWFNAAPQPDGFIFVLFQGSIDTSSTPSASNPLVPFSLRMGTNGNLKTVTMPSKNYSIIHSQTTELHIVVDYAKLFNGVALNNINNLKVNTAADNGGSVATQISNNIVGMFRYE